MQHTFTVTCPECGQDDTSTVDIDFTGASYFVLECEHCDNPYVVELHAAVTTIPCRIIRS